MFNALEIQTATRGTLLCGEAQTRFRSVRTDSRHIEPGDLFVALVGERHDGHDFAAEAIHRGAAGCVVARRTEGCDHAGTAVILVNDTLRALADIASAYLSRFDCPVVAVTGSTGKTTTKELTAAALSPLGRVLSAQESYNNEVGVPLTLLQMNETLKAVVLEFAMRGPGQIRELAQIARPKVGVITNIGESHIGLLGSQENIAEAKGELLEELPASGTAVLNADDRFFERLQRKCGCHCCSFGLSEAAAVRATDVVNLGKTVSMKVTTPAGVTEVVLPFPGLHNVPNALAALAAAITLDVDLGAAASAVATTTLPKMRLEVLQSPSGAVILSDCYNASPSSVSAALDTVVNWPGTLRRVAVLGDMKELGDYAEQAHKALGREVAARGFELVVTVGELSQWIASEAVRSGLSADWVLACESSGDAAEVLRPLLRPGDTVLVKASRAMRLEEVVGGLVA